MPVAVVYRVPALCRDYHVSPLSWRALPHLVDRCSFSDSSSNCWMFARSAGALRAKSQPARDLREVGPVLLWLDV